MTSLTACAARLARPLTARNDVLTVIPGPLPDEEIAARIEAAGAIAIMKVGRHLPRLRRLIEGLGLIDHAGYVERATLRAEKAMPLADVTEAAAPYFSMILIYKGRRSVDATAAILVLTPAAEPVARRIAAALPGATLHGLAHRVPASTCPSPRR